MTVHKPQAEAGTEAVVGKGEFLGRFLFDAEDLLLCTFAVSIQVLCEGGQLLLHP